jgi:hypothetical protein
MADENNENEDLLDEDFEINDDDFLDTDETNFFSAEEKAVLAENERRYQEALRIEQRRKEQEAAMRAAAITAYNQEQSQAPNQNLPDITQQTQEYLKAQEEVYNSQIVGISDANAISPPDNSQEWINQTLEGAYDATQTADQFLNTDLDFSMDYAATAQYMADNEDRDPWYDGMTVTADPDPELRTETLPYDPELAAATDHNLDPHQDLYAGAAYPPASHDVIAGNEMLPPEHQYEVGHFADQAQLARLEALKAEAGATQVPDLSSDIQQADRPPRPNALAERNAEWDRARAYNEANGIKTAAPLTPDQPQGSVERSDRTVSDYNSRMTAAWKVVEERKRYDFINLNPMFTEEALKDKEILGSPILKILFILNKTDFKKKKIVSPKRVPSFKSFYTKAMTSVKPTFEYNDKTFREDLKDSPSSINKNGNDGFMKDYEKLVNVGSEIEKITQSPKYAKLLTPTQDDTQSDLQRWNQPIHQVTIMTEKAKNGNVVFKGLLVFYYSQISAGDFNAYALRSHHVSPVEIDESSPLRNGNVLRYLAELSRIAKAKNDISSRELAKSCTSSTKFAGLKTKFHEYLDYMKFSKQFQLPSITATGGSAIEKNKKAAEEDYWDIDNIDRIMADFKDGVNSITGQLQNYTVHPDDKIEVSSDPNNPSSATYYIKGNVEGTSPLANMAIADTNFKPLTADDIIEQNEDLIDEFSANFNENGNALRAGMVIKIPRPSNAKIDPGLRIKESSVEDMSRIWKETFTDPFLNKLCPATIPERLFDCLYPSNCRELIKYIGLWRTRDLLENFIHVDVFDDRNGLLEALEEWDAEIETSYNFKAVSFNGSGFLKTGAFNGNVLYPSGADRLSVTMQLKTTTAENRMSEIPNQARVNSGKEKYIISQPGTFSIIKDAGGSIVVEIISPEGKNVRYRLKTPAEAGEDFVLPDVFNGNFHQVGFSWVGSTGELFVIINGTEYPTVRYVGQPFRGPLGMNPSSQFIVCSRSPSKSSKGFAGQIDEICIFNSVLTSEQWKKMAKIDTRHNLRTNGMMTDATAWWRMGDSAEDRLGTRPAKIVDLISSLNLEVGRGTNPEDQKIVVVRDFERMDEDRFIDVIGRNTDIVKLCDQILRYLKELIDSGFDFDKIKTDFSNWITPRNFPKDPQFDITLFINGAIIENVIKLMATTLLKIVDEYLLNCDNWKSLLKAATKGSVNLNSESFQSAFAQLGDESPLSDFLNNYDDPAYWNRAVFSSDSITAGLTRGLENELLSAVNVSYGDSSAAPTTLGFGSVVLRRDRVATDPNDLTPDTVPWGGDTSLMIENTSRSELDRRTTVNIIQEYASRLQPTQVLELFSSSPSTETIEAVNDIVRENFTADHGLFNINTIPTIFGSVGSAMGLQNSINQLKNAAQILAANLPSAGTFCGPARSFRERLGEPEAPGARNTVRDMIDFASMKPYGGACGLPIPLTEFERRALDNTVSAAFSSVLQAYDSDLVLHRLGMTSVGQKTKTIPKVLWKGDTVRRKVADTDYFLGICPTPDSEENESELFSWENVEIADTQINPEFEAALAQGYIPLKEDGTVDGTPNGGVIETDWWAWGWPEKRPPRPVKEDEDVRNLGPGKALGPYTDYSEGNDSAAINEIAVAFGGDLANALAGSTAQFALNSADSSGADLRYDSLRTNTYSERGIRNIISKNKTSILGTGQSQEKSRLKDSKTDILYQTPFGRSLEGKKYVKLEKRITDPYVFEAAVDFSISSDIRQELINSGYNDGSEECDDASNIIATREEPYTPQENVFEHIVRQQNTSQFISDSELKIDAYDGVYKEALTAIMMKVADSPLLKPVPNTQGPDNEPLLGINFLNFDTTPRLIDMKTFAKQIAEDYEAFLACPERFAEEPIYKAIKVSISRIMARVCIVELVMKGVVPFSQLYLSKKDPIIKKFLIEKLKLDMAMFLTPDQESGIQAKIVKEFNYLADTAAISAPPLDETKFMSEWEKAMDYYFEDEFDFVANRIKEMVHGECIPDPQEGEDSSGIDKSMYRAIIKYAKEEGMNLHLETYATDADGVRIDGFDFSQPSATAGEIKIVTALYYSFKNKRVVLASIEEDYAAIRQSLGLDEESRECTQNSRYDQQGNTTSEHDHFHTYTIDEFGNGITDTVILSPGRSTMVEEHTHAIASYAVVPRILPNGEIAHSHSLAQRTDQEQVTRESDKERIENYMEEQIMQDSNFKIMFDFCFDLREISSLVLVYCVVSAENQIVFRAFNNTKKAILEMYNWLWQEGPSIEPCATGLNKKYSNELGALFPSVADAFLDPKYLLALLLAPLMTYRGWSKTADPHVFITTSVMDVLELPICPDWQKRNVPNPLNDFEIECMDIPSWPGTSPLDNLFLQTSIPAFVVEWGVGGAVTLAPMAVGLPPFTPTPFGLLYYAAVSPLIWIMRDLPRLTKLMETSALAQQNLASIGMNVGAISCELPTETDSKSEEVPADDCPPVKTMDDTIIDISSAECQDN